jgi:hypothetical protein
MSNIEITKDTISIEEDKNVIKGVYCEHTPNQSLLLSKEDIYLEDNGNSFHGNGQIWLKFLPNPSLQIDITFPSSSTDTVSLLSKMSSKGNILIPARDISTSVAFIKSSFGPNQDLSVTAISQEEPLVTKRRKRIATTVFNLINFWNFQAIGFIVKKEHEKYVSCNRAVLIFRNWKITIESLPETKDRIEIVKKQGGYAVTHIGKIEKLDSSLYNSSEAEKILEALFYFFSFIRGFWAHPQLPIGFDQKNTKVWEVWANYHVSPWRTNQNWFDEHHGKFLSLLFPGFMKVWCNPQWQETVMAAIYWYTRGNTLAAGTDGSIVLIQSALERLSWEFHVNIKESISPYGFERLPAADCIKLILSHAGIPLEIPTELKTMKSIAKEKNLDGPSSFTTIRNRIVHPGKKKGGINPSKAPLFECWNLGLWYLELLLLFIFEYKGSYANRLKLDRWVGQVEELPWSKNITEQSASPTARVGQRNSGR